MPSYFVLGATFAFAAAVQPGQLQAYLISETMAHGWRRTVPAALAPILSDIPIICLVLVVLTRMPQPLVHAIQVLGGIFLLYLAWGAFKSFRSYRQAIDAPSSGARSTVLKAVLVNLLNPNPYLGWTFVMGPLLLDAWREHPLHGVALVATFYITMTLANAALIALFGAARTLGPRVARVLVGISALALAGFGIYQLWSGGTGLFA